MLRLIANGHENREIAAQLATTTGTIETYVTAINRKIGLRSRGSGRKLAIYAARHFGWWPPERTGP